MILLAKLLAASGLLPPLLALLVYSTADDDLAKADSVVVFVAAVAIAAVIELVAGICWLIA